MCEKHSNGRNVSEVWKYTLNKIQRSNERLAQEKSLSKDKMIHNDGPQIRCIPQGSLGLSSM